MKSRIEDDLAKTMRDEISKNPDNLIGVIARAARGQVIDHDTGLYNKRGFDIAKETAKGFLRQGKISCVGVLIIDVDGLKRGNDKYGHDWGTELLRDMAVILQKSVRTEDDDVFRIGGDEFAILLANADQKILTDRINEFKKNRDSHRKDLRFSWGIGYANKAEDLDSAIKTADKSMYRFKNAKKR